MPMWPTEHLLRDRSSTTTTSYESSITVRRALKVTTVAGFSAFIGATIVAHTSPASGYELSIYHSTPVMFWVLWAVSIVAALTVCAYAPRSRFGQYGLLLGGLGAFAVPALPLLRGYYFLGVHDALTHLGYARALGVNARSPLSLVYPTSHTIAVVLSRLSGTGLPHSMMRTVLTFIAIYFVTTVLTVRTLIDDQRAAILAGYSAFLLLPVNTISTYAVFHPFSMATFYLPVLLYLLISYITGENDGEQTGPSMTGMVLLLTGAGYVFLHPQASLNFIILLCAIAGTQSVQRFRGDGGTIANSRRVHGYLFALIAVFFLWNFQHWQLFVTAQTTFDAFMNTIYGQAQAGEVVTEQTSSAGQIGFNPVEIFAKLFLVEGLYCLLAASILVRYLLKRRRDNIGGPLPDCEAAIVYLTVGGLALLPFFFLQFLGAVSSYFFRHIGFGLVLVTVLGSVALYSFLTVPPKVFLTGSPKIRSPKIWRPVLIIAGILLLALSAVALFGSPFMHKYTKHADEQQMMGWETSFEEQAPSRSFDSSGRVWYGTARTPMIRYKQALAYAPGTSWYPGVVQPFPIPTGSVNESAIRNGLVDHYENHPKEVERRDHYFAVSTMTRERAIHSFQELRYSEEAFDSIENQPGVYRVQSNGGFVVYYVDLPESKPIMD